ncbi:hypothetical protein SAMN05444143_10256 [Flavobacterium succinicans]|uniref:Uncharacterized protein n=1 Tax=Flavobacterium succinicans TaxID=29536 RepID=A0A1I4TBS1_9FLAO|nr:hypothetical protein SAMN05444143_10256 [Flavobacterium succinicans]
MLFLFDSNILTLFHVAVKHFQMIVNDLLMAKFKYNFT